MTVRIKIVFERLADGVEQIVLGMPHRGKLNVLTCLLNFPPVRMFSKIKGNPDFPTKYQATGDVLSHLSEYAFLGLMVI